MNSSPDPHSKSPLRRLHTATKTALFCTSLLSALLLKHPLSLFVFLVGWVVPCSLAAGALHALCQFTLRIVAPTYFMLLVVYGIMVVPPNLGPDFRIASIGVYLAGVINATTIAVRLTAIGAAAVTFAVSTSPVELSSGLRALRVPSPVAAAFTASFGLLSVARRKMTTIIDAQRSRGALVHRNPLRRVYAYMPLLRPLTFSLMLSAVDRAMVWTHRGLLHARPRRTEPPKLRDWLVVSLSGAVFVSAVIERWLH